MSQQQEAKEKKSMSLRFSKAIRGAAASAERAANSAFASKESAPDSPERGSNHGQDRGSAHGSSNRSSGGYPAPLSFDSSGTVTSHMSTNPFDEAAQADEEKRDSSQSDDEGKEEVTTVFGSPSNKSLESAGTANTTTSGGKTGGSAKFPSMKDNLSQEKVLSELGVGRSASWRIPIFGDFEQVQVGGRVSEREFLAFMQRRGHEPLWCRASYNAFAGTSSEEVQGLDQFQYLLAVSALTFNRGSSDSGNNARWVSIRQLLVYNVFLLSDQQSEQEREGGEVSTPGRSEESSGMSSTGFVEFLSELSSSDESPYYYGISNGHWWPKRDLDEEGMGSSGGMGASSGSGLGGGKRTSLELIDQSTMAESLAISKVQLASKQSEYEALELQYLKLEKQMCKLKLELADEKAKRDAP